MGDQIHGRPEHRELVMVPRGARWLAVGWDFSLAALQEFQSQSHDGRLRLRIQPGEEREKGYTFLVLHPKATSWYVPLTRERAVVQVEFGYFDRTQPGNWTRLAMGSWPKRSHHRATDVGQGVPFPFNHAESWDPSAKHRGNSQGIPDHGMDVSGQTGLSSGIFYNRNQPPAPRVGEVHPHSLSTGRLQRDPAPDTRPNHPTQREISTGGAQEARIQATLEMDHTFHGRVEDGATVYFNGKAVPVKNGGFSFRVASSEGMKVYELSVISADGSRRQIHRYQWTGHVEVVNLPEIVPGLLSDNSNSRHNAFRDR